MSPSLSTSDGEKIMSSPKADGEKNVTLKTSSTSDGEKIISSAPKADGEKNVTLKTFDGETFEVAIDVISQSQTIKHMIEDDCANEFIPLPNVDGKVLAKVIEYCEKHYKPTDIENVDHEKKKNEIRQWDIEFMTSMQDSAMELVLAANYLEIKGLFDLSAQKIAENIKDIPVDDVRKIFNVEKDFQTGEEEELKKKYGDAGWTESQ